MSQFERQPFAMIGNALAKRFAFQDRPTTAVILSVILGWYLIEIAVAVLQWDPVLVKWIFTTESFPSLSPGLVLAIISHAFPPNWTHIVGNVLVLWIFAGESEQHMGRLETLGFFVMTSLFAVWIGTALSGRNTLGASGGALAFIGFYGVHIRLQHDKLVKKSEYEHGLLSEESLQSCWGVAVVIGPPVLVVYLLGQLAGLVPVGRADVIGHLTGILCGMSYAFIRPLLVDWLRSERLR